MVRTRQTPKRVQDLLDGGSLFWVFKGQILCRQSIISVETRGEGAARSCAIGLDPALARVVATPRRPFQGWRYMTAADAPPDLDAVLASAVPADLERTLREIGAW